MDKRLKVNCILSILNSTQPEMPKKDKHKERINQLLLHRFLSVIHILK